MDELFRAVSQFLPDAPGGMSGGFNQPSAPEGSSGLPFFAQEDENLDQPGPSGLEGESQAVRDCGTELQNIQGLQEDGHLGRSYRNALIIQEQIVIEMKKRYLLPDISDKDIREGVEIDLTNTMNSKSPPYRNRRLSIILKDLTDHGAASPHFAAILKKIESLTGPLVSRE